MSLLGSIRGLFRSKRRESPLKVELRNLRRNYHLTEDHLRKVSSEFWANGGVCCPNCGVPGYSALQDKQERREARIKQIEAKLARNPN